MTETAIVDGPRMMLWQPPNIIGEFRAVSDLPDETVSRVLDSYVRLFQTLQHVDADDWAHELGRAAMTHLRDIARASSTAWVGFSHELLSPEETAMPELAGHDA